MEITELDFGLNKYENFSKFFPNSQFKFFPNNHFKFDQIKIFYNDQEVGEVIGNCTITTELFNNKLTGVLTGHRIILDSSIFNRHKKPEKFNILINNIYILEAFFDKGNCFVIKNDKIIIENFYIKFNKIETGI